MSDKEKDFWKQEWKEKRERALVNKWYAIGRLDLLVISISAGGIYVVLTLLEYSLDPVKELEFLNSIWLKLVGVTFLIAIISNFISQMFGYGANKQDSIRAREKMYQVNELKEFNEKKLSNAECWIDIHNKGVDISNGISIGLMIVGLVGLSVLLMTI